MSVCDKCLGPQVEEIQYSIRKYEAASDPKLPQNFGSRGLSGAWLALPSKTRSHLISTTS